MTTKERIIDASISLFNEHGLVNVRLQQIADKAGISVGNLAYHYYSKEAIVATIVDQLSELLEPIISEENEYPGLMDFDTQLARYYHLLMKYSFFFIDILEIERNYPKQFVKRNAITDRITNQFHHWIKRHEECGILIPETREGHYAIIAHSIWMIITFYLARPVDHGSPEDSERVFKEVVWSHILPHFTEIGRLEFDLLIERLLDSFTPTKSFTGPENE